MVALPGSIGYGDGMNTAALAKKADVAGDLLKVLANPARLRILCFLHEGERAVNEIEAHLGLRQSALSQQLAILRRERLVKTRRSAQFIYYSLSSDEARQIIDVLYAIYCAPRLKGDAKSKPSEFR